MTRWVMEALGVDQARANHLRTHYWHTYGTTLAGLMREHDLDPGPYLHDVHEISFEALVPDPNLAARIKALPGRCIVYTNGTARYAERVIAARGLDGLFQAVYGVEHAGFLPTPERAPHEMGMGTVHVAPVAAPADHIHFHTDDLGTFLKRITG